MFLFLSLFLSLSTSSFSFSLSFSFFSFSFFLTPHSSCRTVLPSFFFTVFFAIGHEPNDERNSIRTRLANGIFGFFGVLGAWWTPAAGATPARLGRSAAASGAPNAAANLHFLRPRIPPSAGQIRRLPTTSFSTAIPFSIDETNSWVSLSLSLSLSFVSIFPLKITSKPQRTLVDVANRKEFLHFV